MRRSDAERLSRMFRRSVEALGPARLFAGAGRGVGCARAGRRCDSCAESDGRTVLVAADDADQAAAFSRS